VTVATDPLYIAARCVLLDALEALAGHRDAVIIVGAQAVYLHSNDADLDAGVAPYTTDGDLAIVPHRLSGEPEIADAMRRNGFTLKVKAGGGVEPGSWLATVTVDGQPQMIPVDLIVPGELAPNHGRRDARLPDHGSNATRWAAGLEAAVLDNQPMTVGSLQPDADARQLQVRVAGPAALLIAKCHKIYERLQDSSPGRAHRVRSKDSGDVIRLMRGLTSGEQIGRQMAAMADDAMAGSTVAVGVTLLESLFGRGASPGIAMAAEALTGALDAEQIRALAPAFVAELTHAYRG
jgi:hypothetical protein